MSRKHVCTGDAMPSAIHLWLKVDRRGIKEGRIDRKVIYINGSLHKAIPRHLGSNIPHPSNYTLCINVYIPRIPNA